MQVTTYEATVENGVIKLLDNVSLPEKAKVFVVVPELYTPPAKIHSPRLLHREQAKDFVKQVSEEEDDASLRS